MIQRLCEVIMVSNNSSNICSSECISEADVQSWEQAEVDCGIADSICKPWHVPEFGMSWVKVKCFHAFQVELGTWHELWLALWVTATAQCMTVGSWAHQSSQGRPASEAWRGCAYMQQQSCTLKHTHSVHSWLQPIPHQWQASEFKLPSSSLLTQSQSRRRSHYPHCSWQHRYSHSWLCCPSGWQDSPNLCSWLDNTKHIPSHVMGWA